MLRMSLKKAVLSSKYQLFIKNILSENIYNMFFTTFSQDQAW